MIILVFILSFILGILLASLVSLPPIYFLLIILIALGVLLVEKIKNGLIGKPVALVALVLVSLALGILRYDIKDFHIPSEPGLEGIVVSEPEQRDNYTRFVYKSDNGERILVNTDLYSPVQYGDRVVLKGSLKRPGIIEGEDGRNFDYARYLSKDDIYYTMSFAQVEVLGSGHGHPLKATLLDIKSSFVSKVRGILAEPESSLLAGLLVAGKDSLPEGILENFRRAGLVHIVVLSGYNITIIAESIRKFFAQVFLKLKPERAGSYSAFLSVFGIVFFVIMTGGEPTVMRASLMVLVVILGKSLHRTYSAPRALLLAAFIMLVINPKILTLDASFQLSFLATLALIYVVPVVEGYLEFVSEKWGLRTVIATTLATQLTVLPYLIYKIGDVSLVSLPTNILVLIFIPITMFLGFIAASLAYVSTILALPFSYLTHLLLSWILWVSEFFGNLSFSSIKIPPIHVSVVMGLYLLLAFMLVYLGRPRNSSPHSASSSSRRSLPRTVSSR